MVEAARRLPQVQFVVVGGMDADVERLRALAAGAPNVRIDGFQPPERVSRCTSRRPTSGWCPIDPTPAISARYTSPLKVFEAFACGLPLVASDLPSLRELLEHERDAVLVAPDDAQALAEGIERLLGDEALRADIAQRLRARAEACTWDARARRILAAFGSDEALGANLEAWPPAGDPVRRPAAPAMRVLYLTDSLSDLDGVGRYAVRLISAAQRIDPELEAHVLLARKHRPSSDAVPSDWRIDVGLPPDYFLHMNAARFWPELAWATVRVARAARGADLVHAIKDFPHNLVAVLGARLAGLPCIATAHGTYSVQPLVAGPHRRLAQWTYEHLVAMVAVSGYTAGRLLEHLGPGFDRERLHVIPNSVEAEHYRAARVLAGARPWHDVEFSLSIGELKERKGHRIAVEAWCRVAREHPGLHHFVVGRLSDEAYHQALVETARQAQVAERLHFLDNVEEDEKVDLLQRAQVFLHTPVTGADGRFEGFGIVYLEAAASGTPSIGTLESGAVDAVVEGETGLLVEPTADAVAVALERLVVDTALRERLARDGRVEYARARSRGRTTRGACSRSTAQLSRSADRTVSAR